MKCLGCGGKAGGDVLRLAFERLTETYPQWQRHQALRGPADAAELSDSGRMVDLVTVDFFQAFMNDAWLVGRIAALNACGDLWAMGGAPRHALASITLPQGHEEAQAETLFQTLAGALHEFSQANVELVGGHTIEGTSLTVGFTILGSLLGHRPLRKSGLTPGDALILTKPLGTGVLLAGMMSGQMRAAWRPTMLDSMLTSNQLASQTARRHGAAAMTDVTGFGLAGHLREMLLASGTSATLWLNEIPLLPGAADLWSSGLRSTLDPANRQLTSDVLSSAETVSRRADFASLFDPQTSGGLLLGINSGAVEPLLEELRRSGLKATQIGTVTAAETHSDCRLTIS